RTPCHGGKGWGGRHRFSPTGAAANGIPLKLETSPSVTPRTIPVDVRTVGATAGVEALAPVPGPVCANVKGTLIKRHSAKMGRLDFTFLVLSWLSAFVSADHSAYT